MSNWPRSAALCTWFDRLTLRGPGGALDGFGALGGPGAAAWPAANKIIYQPFRLPFNMSIVRAEIINGGTVSGNVDVGIYSHDGRLLTSIGSTAQSGTNQSQNFNFADARIGPGQFFMGLGLSSGTATLDRWNIAARFLRAAGFAKQDSTFPLPATATFAAMDADFAPQVVIFGDTATHVANPTNGDGGIVPSRTIHPYSREAVGATILNFDCGAMTAATSAVWPGADQAVVYPFIIQRKTSFASMWCMNGSAVSGNIDLGIYGPSGRLLASTGSTAQAGTDTVQTIALSVTLTPGQYYAALGCSNTTAQFYRVTALNSGHFNPIACLWYNANFPLGAAVGNGTGNNYLPLFGLGRGTAI